MSEKISFDVDWDALFPGKPFTVGNKTHNITPLNIEGIARISKKIKVILPIVQAEGITWGNINDVEMIVKLIPILMDNTPEIVSEATKIELESLIKFPPSYLLEIVTIAVQVNLESKEALEKNFESLVKIFQSLPEMKTQGVEN
jgi:hypothetical protein